MALIRTRGIILIICFLIAAGILEYFIIRHIYSGQGRVLISDWENPKLSDGFSKVDSVEVENLEAKIKKIKIIPGGSMQEWMDKKKEILRNWISADSGSKKEDVIDEEVNVLAPPSLNQNRQQERNGEDTAVEQQDGRADEKGKDEPPLQKRAAIDKKMEEDTHDQEELDEHGKLKSTREKDLEGEHKPGVFEKAAQALGMLNNFREAVNAVVKNGKKKEKAATDTDVVFSNEFVDEQKNSAFFNGHRLEGEVLVETDPRLHSRYLSPFEAAGNNIMFTLRTTKPYHDKRLPLLFETWMRKANHSNIFIVTDGEDKKWVKKIWDENMHYILTSCGKTYLRNELCCKAGIELALIFKEGLEHYDWLCHIDDDIYVNVKQLVRYLSKFDPKKDAVYFGRSGSGWKTPRTIMEGAEYGKPGQTYHFAVGGMYCLSRPLMEMAKPYLIGGKNFAQSCAKTLEPEDVTVGVVVGVVLNKTLSRTEAIYTHGLHLGSTVDPYTLDRQIAFAYGYGAIKWGYEPYNAIYVPNGLYSYTEDESQFRSLFCALYPDDHVCVEKVLSLKEAYNSKQQQQQNNSPVNAT